MNIGVCGTGTIASWISDIICQMQSNEIVLYTCATSAGFDCISFAQKYGYQKVSATFDDLMKDPQVDLVYIAVPNNFHYDMCMKAIGYGKNVVCEKPFTVGSKQCQNILKAAREKGVFISEALWSAFLPAYRMVKEEIAAGTIGTLLSASIIMLDNIMFLERVKTLAVGGGVLLDEGPYALGCMIAFFGTDIISVDSYTRKLDTGVDAEEEIKVKYSSGYQVYIHQSMDTPEEEQEQYVEIVGTAGRIWMNAVANPSCVKVIDVKGNVIKELDIPEQIKFRGMPPVSGYEYEWIGFEEALRNGSRECAEITHESMLAAAKIMDIVLNNANIGFPFSVD